MGREYHGPASRVNTLQPRGRSVDRFLLCGLDRINEERQNLRGIPGKKGEGKRLMQGLTLDQGKGVGRYREGIEGEKRERIRWGGEEKKKKKKKEGKSRKKKKNKEKRVEKSHLLDEKKIKALEKN